MPHRIYGQPDHRLHRIRATLWLPYNHNENTTRITVQGESETARTALWSHSESWTVEEQVAGLQPTDALHHLFIIGVQDRPRDQEALWRLLTGFDKGQQLELWE